MSESPSHDINPSGSRSAGWPPSFSVRRSRPSVWLALGALCAVGYLMSVLVPHAFTGGYFVASAALVCALVHLAVDGLWPR